MARNSRLQKAAAKQAGSTPPAISNLTLQEAALFGVTRTQREQPYVNLKYYWPDFECFSVWSQDELKSFSGFCRKLSNLTWADIYRSAGSSGSKAGLGYTPHKNLSVLPKLPQIEGVISPDLTWFELRVDEKSRVHGFRSKDAFFLVFLDRGHQIYPG